MDKNTDFSKILKKSHENKWVAISEDGNQVVAYNDKLVDLQEEVGTKKVTYIKVLPADVSFAF